MLRLRGVILKIGCRGAGRLPDALQVRLAVGGARQRLLVRSRRALRSGNERGRQGNCSDGDETVGVHTKAISGLGLAKIRAIVVHYPVEALREAVYQPAARRRCQSRGPEIASR